MNLRNLFLLFLVNNLLHYINEKVVIIIFLIVFFYILKIGQNLLETEYSSKVTQLSNEVENYLLSLFDILRFYKDFFRRLSDLKLDFQSNYLKLKKNVYTNIVKFKISKTLYFLNNLGYLKKQYFA